MYIYYLNHKNNNYENKQKLQSKKTEPSGIKEFKSRRYQQGQSMLYFQRRRVLL